MNVEYIETILTVCIVSVQIIIFYRTRSQIRLFRNIIPETSSIGVAKLFVPTNEISQRAPQEILANSSIYKVPTDTGDTQYEGYSGVTIVESTANKNAIFEKILQSINTYLLRNSNSTSDFNLIKDITERNTNAVEEDINLTISIPLYLGLMGTMLGIIIGLYSMADLSSVTTGKVVGDPLGQGISILLGGVKIAMIASFVGLFLTTVNSGGYFKGSKGLVETNKNEFYTFIQTELLPSVNQSLGSTFESFQRNLFKFNGEFSNNLNTLSGVFKTNFDTLNLQHEILSKIQNIDVVKIAEYNVDVLRELQKSMDDFEKFNTHFSNINSYVNNSASIINSINELLARTENFKKIADNLENQFSQSKELMDFLSAHFKDLDDYKQQTKVSMAETGHSITETFSDLKRLIENSSQSVKDFTVQELDLLSKALSESKTNLSNLEFLQTINNDVSLFKDSSASQSERIRTLLQDLNKNVINSNIALNNIERNSSSQRRTGIKSYFKQLFSSDDEHTQFAVNYEDIHATSPELRQQKSQQRQEQKRQVKQRQERQLNREVFYLSTPNEDGSFNEETAQSSYKEGTSIYKFTKITYDKAEFQIDERESSIKTALEYPDKNIDPVCDAQNAFDPKAGRIVTVQGGSGKAELVGDKWRVIRKAKIAFEP